MKRFFKLTFNLLSKKDKRNILLLVLFSIVISIVEVIGVSAIMPFISVSTDFSKIHSNNYISTIYELFYFENELNFILFFGISLVLFYICRGGINLFFVFLTQKFIQLKHQDIGYRIFEIFMKTTYKNFTQRNSSNLTKSVTAEVSNLTNFIQAILMIISEVFIIIFIVALLLFVSYEITILLGMFLVIMFFIMKKTLSLKIKKYGDKRASFQKIYFEVLNKSFGNYKFIKLHKNNTKFLDEFNESSLGYADSNIYAQTFIQLPRLFLEAVSFSTIIIIILALLFINEGDIVSTLPIITMFIIALYRLMPSVNRIMTSYNTLMFSYRSLEIITEELSYETEDIGDEDITFQKNIILKDVDFTYDEKTNLFSKLNLTINKGEKIAFIGESGTGKSTLVDIIMGLYRLNSGKILVDNIFLNKNNMKIWREKIGYIPQSIYLFDGTVGQNIALSEEYDTVKVDECLKKAKIYDFLASKDGQNTFVGESGVLLSGGQKQRIAIARALYTNPDILVLDEATSALDDKTEKQIMDEVYSITKDKTLIIIAHRLSTIEKCDKVYKIENGNIVNV